MDIKSTALLLFLAMDSPGNLSIFTSALRHLEPRRRWQVIVREMVFALFILLSFLFIGDSMLQGLRLQLETLSIAGGLILFLIALRMIFPQPNGTLGLASSEEPFLVPLAIPLIAGPSALALILQQAASYPQQLCHVALAVVLAWVASLLILLSGTFCVRWLGKKGLSALERVMGLILLLVAIQMVLDGLQSYMTVLKG